ncbi:MAG: hypothetical protein KGJ55_12350 [Gammaproteobacteria bacterium]|nr:hypothetical protein [Gammaproteobacteria bacterium]
MLRLLFGLVVIALLVAVVLRAGRHRQGPLAAPATADSVLARSGCEQLTGRAASASTSQALALARLQSDIEACQRAAAARAGGDR